MKKIIIILYIVIFTKGMCQVKVSEYEAVMGATRALEQRGFCEFRSEQIFYDVSSQGDTLLYEVAMTNGYSVLLSGYKSCVPILAIYKNNGGQSIFAQNGYKGATVMVDAYHKMVEDNLSEHCRQNNNGQWDTLLNITDTVEQIRAPSHLLTTQWGEKESNDGVDLNAYNRDCPYINGCYALAGSAAVAMGQIMKYWNYPFFSLYNGQNFGWCNMGDELVTTDDCFETKKEVH